MTTTTQTATERNKARRATERLSALRAKLASAEADRGELILPPDEVEILGVALDSHPIYAPEPEAEG